MRDRSTASGPRLRAFAYLAVLIGCACAPSETPTSWERSATLIHLATAIQPDGMQAGPSSVASRVERHWSFTEAQPEWTDVSSELYSSLGSITRLAQPDALRLELGSPPRPRGPLRLGGLMTTFDEALTFADWETLIVRARTSDRFAGVTVAANLHDEGGIPDPMGFFSQGDETPPMFSDGSVQSYAIPLLPPAGEDAPEQLESVAVLFGAMGDAKVDVLSITLVPRGAGFPESVGTRQLTRDGTTRHTLYAHTPARLSYELEVPAGGRLDTGLTSARGERIDYRVAVVGDDGRRVLHEQTHDDPERWHQLSVDLSSMAGQRVELVLEADSAVDGSLALWGAPIVSRPAEPRRPNVVFYVIDGGDADLMSLYGYERATTPYLEELAAEGVVFTRAHSNSTWTQPSTVSFMTSLHHSVLGGLRRGIHSTAMPAAAVPMAERFRDGGYQTFSLTANPNAGRIIGTDRGVDVLRDVETAHHSTSSIELHERFFALRDEYPGGPTWVHFQTTDVHEPNDPHEPYLGRFVTAEQREQLDSWDQQLWMAGGQFFGRTSIGQFYDQALERADIDRQAYYGARKGLYDETMLHQDHALREFVDELKARGEWEHTLLVIGSDHGHPAGTFARFGRGLIEPPPEPWQGALFDAYATRIPLLVIWPGEIEGGRRIDQPVSMIDVLPTVLELAGLPAPDVLQGQSLVPLLRGEDVDPRPVVLDEFRVDEETGEMVGNLELIDGRWGASLEIGPLPAGSDPSRGRHPVPIGGRWGAVHPFYEEAPRMLLYDLEADPFATQAVNDAHPELVRRYTSQLVDLWQAHQALSQRYQDAEDVTLSPEQLEQLRALGYIR